MFERAKNFPDEGVSAGGGITSAPRSAVAILIRAIFSAAARGRRVAVVDTAGGLGNQLFQYAFGRHLEKRGFDVLHEIRRLLPGADPVGRTYRLHPLAPRTIVLPRNRLFRGALWRTTGFQLRWERNWYDFAEVETAGKRPVLFSGYWQHPRYGVDSIGEVRAILAKVRVEHPMMERPGVVVGARRGDYASGQPHLQHIGTLAPEYYEAALRCAPAGFPVYLFSDETVWAERVLRAHLESRLARPVRVVADEFDDWQTLALMSHGVFHVIANSTFHWWAAALSSTSRGCVAPEPWMRSLNGRCEILPPQWRTAPAVFE